MGVLLVYVTNHLFTVGILLREEVHGVPQIVRTPILPVLDDAVEGHLQFTIPVNHAEHLGCTLVTLLALPEAKRPKREHGHLSR